MSRSRNRNDSRWDSKRQQQPNAPKPNINFEKRVYMFTSKVIIHGVGGVACVEPITNPLRAAPDATVRVVVRWSGDIKTGTIIDVDGVPFLVHKHFPMAENVKVAHMLCSRTN
jgi:hypothetical protein